MRENKRQHTATIMKGERRLKVAFCEGESILQILQRQKIAIPAICNGRGTCGKCIVRVVEGKILPMEQDLLMLSKAQRDDGLCLSCKAYPTTDCTIEIIQSEDRLKIVTEVTSEDAETPIIEEGKDSEYKLAIDIGTTTIAMKLLSREGKDLRRAFTLVNSQRMYGADVISRIQASYSSLSELKDCIRSDIEKGITYYADEGFQVNEMYITGNTTMLHLLLGLSCESLGKYPFIPVQLDCVTTTILGKKAVILPGISAFVGADIVAGLLSTNQFDANQVALFIDLGTNAELAIFSKDHIVVSSAAAGPAFEGGNISCGVAGIPGAISGVTIEDGKHCHVQVIGDKKPIGLCGSGLVEVIAELLLHQIIDETGLLREEYFDRGYVLYEDEERSIVITQKDIRQYQLAKAAIRAGIEILIKKFGCSMKEITHVYVSGGFGYFISVEKAVSTGLFPKELESLIKPVGNTSLEGCVQFAGSKEAREKAERIRYYAKEITLAQEEKFNDLYIQYMNFDTN